MSLVNQVLRDLEARREREQSREGNADVRAVRISHHHTRRLVGATTLVIFLVGIGLLVTVRAGLWPGTRSARVVEPPPARTAPGDSPHAAPTPAVTQAAGGQASQPPEPAKSAMAANVASKSAHRRATSETQPPSREGERQAQIAAVAKSASPTSADPSTSESVDHKPAQATASNKTRRRPAPNINGQQPAAIKLSADAEPATPGMRKTPSPPTATERAARAYAAGLAALKAGNGSRAETKLRGALDADPTAYAAREALAGLLNRDGRVQDAMQLLRAGKRADPDRAGRYTRLRARLLVARQQTDQAAAVLKRQLAEAPASAKTRAFLAALLERQGQHQHAIDNYLKALAKSPANGQWWAGLGVAYEQLGDDRKALAAYRRARRGRGLERTLAAWVDRRINALTP